MNAAFLLLTSAWLAGQAAPPPPAKPAPPPAPAPMASGACCDSGAGCCDSGCDSGCGGGLFARLRGLFHRHDDCCDTCSPCAKPAPAPSHHDCCAAPACDDCGCGGGLFARLRGWFHRHDDCCDTCGTDCCGATAAHGPMAPPPEPIKAPKSSEPPKAMPKGSTSGAGLTLPQPAFAPTSTLIIDR